MKTWTVYLVGKNTGARGITYVNATSRGNAMVIAENNHSGFWAVDAEETKQ